MEKVDDIIPVLRFPKFDGEWQKETLGSISSWASGGTPSKDNSSYWDGDIPWISASSMRGIEYSDSNLKITSEGLKKGSKLAPKENLLILVRGSMLFKTIPIGITMKDVAFNQDVKSIDIDPSNNVKYILYWFLSSEAILLNMVTGTGIGAGKLDMLDLKNLPLYLPSLPEQQKIASFLTAADDKIQQLTKKKKLLEQYKKGVMQKIFKQEIRFRDDDGKDFPEWEKVELGDILNYEQPTKYLVSNTEYDNSYETPVLTAGKTFVLGYTNEKEGFFKDNLPTIIFDDFTTAFKYVDFTFKAKSSAMKMLIPKEDAVNMKFVYEVMKTLKFPLGEHKRYWISEFQYLKIKYPNTEEQQKITDFLTAIDNKIELANTQLERTQAFKKGLLQQMFV